jgi:hypothetical protein
VPPCRHGTSPRPRRAGSACPSLACRRRRRRRRQGSTKPLFATLNGKNEIGQDGKKSAGDPNGLGSFTAIREGNRLCYAVVVRNIAKPVAGGIFRGRSTVVGEPNFNLKRPTSGDPGATAFCRSALGTQLDRIFSKPSDYYVDIATRRFRSDNTGGAIRGQLARAAAAARRAARSWQSSTATTRSARTATRARATTTATARSPPSATAISCATA